MQAQCRPLRALNGRAYSEPGLVPPGARMGHSVQCWCSAVCGLPGMTKCLSCSCCSVEMPKMCLPFCIRYSCRSPSLSAAVLSVSAVYVCPQTSALMVLLLSRRSFGFSMGLSAASAAFLQHLHE